MKDCVMNIPGKVNMVVALACEAKPLIKHFKLTKLPQTRHWPVFANESRTLHLIISGVGKIKSATSTIYLQCLTGNNPATCSVNIGIAGCSHYSVAKLVQIYKITDTANHNCYYPLTYRYQHGESDELFTVDCLQDYPQKGLVDMEGAGFFQAGSQCVSKELLQVVKIVSDNSAESLAAVKPVLVEQLFADNLASIDILIKRMQVLSAQELAIEDQQNINIIKFTQRWHFTQYQQLQLKELLRRWQVHRASTDPLAVCKTLSSAKQVLALLENELLNIDYSW